MPGVRDAKREPVPLHCLEYIKYKTKQQQQKVKEYWQQQIDDGQ